MVSGSAEFNLPVFSWQDNKSRLKLDVSLNYSSGNGLKVNEIASNTGQGWSLITGGVIARLQAGEPDDQIASNENSNYRDLTKYPNGFMHQTELSAIPTNTKYYPTFKEKNILYKNPESSNVDLEYDQYLFRFNNKTGIFLLWKNVYEVSFIFLNKNNMKVWFLGKKLKSQIMIFINIRIPERF